MTSEMLKYLEESYAKLWEKRPEEIGNLFERNKKNGKHFSVWVNAYVTIESVCSTMSSAAVWGAKGEGDLETYKSVCVGTLKGASSTFKISYGMDEFSGLLAKAADAFQECKSFDEMRALARAMHLYCVRMWYWIDGVLPWAKISKFFNETMGL